MSLGVHGNLNGKVVKPAASKTKSKPTTLAGFTALAVNGPLGVAVAATSSLPTNVANQMFVKNWSITNPQGAGVQGTPSKGPFYYNAPMVKSAYFNPLALPKQPQFGYAVKPGTTGDVLSMRDLQRVITDPGREGLFHFVNQGVYNDAKKAWAVNADGSIAGGRGTIQMDRQTNTTEILANALKTAKSQKKAFDKNMYGFKFMYNPKEINMSWGAIANANPQFESMQLDTIAPMASNMLSSTITFDIILNRMEDMVVLNPNGTYSGSSPYPSWSPVNKNEKGELKKIVEMGTMYDLEYLFKALHGYAGNSNFTSSLRGQSSDPGWLPVRPVELHLGNMLRYRVRVSNLAVRHAIFNSRMVPVFSTVSFTCNRYWDGTVSKPGAAGVIK
jgi:hypothetical protein